MGVGVGGARESRRRRVAPRLKDHIVLFISADTDRQTRLILAKRLIDRDEVKGVKVGRRMRDSLFDPLTFFDHLGVDDRCSNRAFLQVSLIFP